MAAVTSYENAVYRSSSQSSRFFWSRGCKMNIFFQLWYVQLFKVWQGFPVRVASKKGFDSVHLFS